MAHDHGDGTADDGSPGFERIDHTADVGVRVRGRTLEDLFARAARALFAVLLGSPPSAGPDAAPGRVVVEAPDLEGLLQAWLSELLYRFSAERRVGVAFAVLPPVHPGPGAPWRLEAGVAEEPLEPARHVVETALKAVTFHQLRVEERSGGGWEAQVIFDA
jgi:SHS2 domain-containing protein